MAVGCCSGSNSGVVGSHELFPVSGENGRLKTKNGE